MGQLASPLARETDTLGPISLGTGLAFRRDEMRQRVWIGLGPDETAVEAGAGAGFDSDTAGKRKGPEFHILGPKNDPGAFALTDKFAGPEIGPAAARAGVVGQWMRGHSEVFRTSLRERSLRVTIWVCFGNKSARRQCPGGMRETNWA